MSSIILLLLLLFIHHGECLGCMPGICEGNEKNDLRPCPDSDGICGEYRGKRNLREDNRIVNGVDVKCRSRAELRSPFDGKVQFWRPFGGRKGFECADFGLRIEGSGQWQGYHVLISSLTPDFYGGNVKQGQRIGSAIGRACSEGIEDNFHDYVRIELYRRGEVVDPTNHLKECMCTGQICESNPTNKLIGQRFESNSRYNGVKGWDIRCSEIEGNDKEDEKSRIPWIYSPIEGREIGRIRLNTDDDGKYKGCENDGLFIVGTGVWKDFEVRFYNVQFRSDLGLGRKMIEQGQEIAKRLGCGNAPDSVFLEVRYRGQVVDISNMISAENCRLPEMPLP